MCVCPCSCVQMHIQVCLGIWRPEDNLGARSSNAIYGLIKGLSQTWNSAMYTRLGGQ